MSTFEILPTVIDITVVGGTDNFLTFAITKVGPDGLQIGENINDDTITFTAREFYGGPIKIATKTNAPGEHLDGAGGKTEFHLTRGDLASSDPSSEVEWVYEIRRRDQDNYEYVHIQGKLILATSVGLS